MSDNGESDHLGPSPVQECPINWYWLHQFTSLAHSSISFLVSAAGIVWWHSHMMSTIMWLLPLIKTFTCWKSSKFESFLSPLLTLSAGVICEWSFWFLGLTATARSLSPRCTTNAIKIENAFWFRLVLNRDLHHYDGTNRGACQGGTCRGRKCPQ